MVDLKTYFDTLNLEKLSNGETICYRKLSHSSAKKNLVLIHGAVASSSGPFDDIISILQKNTLFNILAMDLRGSGNSSLNNRPKSFNDMANDIKLLLEQLNMKENIILGHSMGGLIAMKLAANYPEFVEKLILLSAVGCQGLTIFYEDEDPNTHVKTPKKCKKRKDILKSSLAMTVLCVTNKDVDLYIKFLEMVSFNVGKKIDNDKLKKYAEGAITHVGILDCAKFIVNYNITNEKTDMGEGTGEIKKIKAKTLIIHGENDILVPIEGAKLNSRELGDLARLEIIPNCGHIPSLSEPELTARLIEDFI